LKPPYSDFLDSANVDKTDSFCFPKEKGGGLFFAPAKKAMAHFFLFKKKAVAYFASSVNFFHNDLEVMMSRSKGIKF
jgi:hypothetical protein